MSLNELFVQILESELKAKERKDFFNEIKNNICVVRQQLQLAYSEANILQADVNEKVNELCAEELECQWLRTRDSILAEQLADQTKQKQVYDEQLANLKSLQERGREDLSASISHFVRDFGLTSNGQEKRLTLVKEQVTDLKVKQQQLEEELEICNKQKEILISAEREKCSTEEEIAKMRMDITELEKSVNKEKVRTRQLEERKSTVAGKPHTDRDFKRLQTELDTCRDDSLEGLCQALRQQIDQLQRQQWQQQLQQQHMSAGMRTESHFQRTHQFRTQASTSSSQPTWSASYNTADQQITHHASSSLYNRKETPNETEAKSKTSKLSNPSRPNLGRLKNALKCKVEEN